MSAIYYEVPKSDYLEHHGVKGMKWGVRKNIANESKNGFDSLSQLTGKLQGRRRRKKTRMAARRMTDEELKKAIGRMQLEQQYNNLSEQTRKAGQIQVSEILNGAGLALGVAASGFAIAESVQKLRGKG